MLLARTAVAPEHLVAGRSYVIVVVARDGSCVIVGPFIFVARETRITLRGHPMEGWVSLVIRHRDDTLSRIMAPGGGRATLLDQRYAIHEDLHPDAVSANGGRNVVAPPC